MFLKVLSWLYIRILRTCIKVTVNASFCHLVPINSIVRMTAMEVQVKCGNVEVTVRSQQEEGRQGCVTRAQKRKSLELDIGKDATIKLSNVPADASIVTKTPKNQDESQKGRTAKVVKRAGAKTGHFNSSNEQITDKSCPTEDESGPSPAKRCVTVVTPSKTSGMVTVSNDAPSDEADTSLASSCAAKVLSNLVENLDPPSVEDRDCCAVCLEPPVHPVLLDCNHSYCFLCAKGLIEGSDGRCSLCRQRISRQSLSNVKLNREESNGMKWFYESANMVDWWQFEERNSDELEEYYQAGLEDAEMLICGHVYIINFMNMTQRRKNGCGRIRSIRRGQSSEAVLGVAGISTSEK